jgi:nicotinamide-nucleotide amidase
MHPSGSRPLVKAELLSIGAELTTGETRDTNAGDLARDLSELGVVVTRLVALPDDQPIIVGALSDALERADVVLTTGGLGPTPDDRTRESIAEACGETPAVDPETEAWLRGLWARRGLAFPERNLKQAWLIPSATPVPNANGTAPGWWVDRPDGRVVIALPGPPREMRPMWADWVLPRLLERGLGSDRATRTLRLVGVGESQVADLLGDEILGRDNPVTATYARADGVDVRITASASPGLDGGPPASAIELLEGVVDEVLERVRPYLWGHGRETWPAVIGRLLADRGWTLAVEEAGARGALIALLAGTAGLTSAVMLADEPARAGETAPAGETARAGEVAPSASDDRVRPTPADDALATSRLAARERAQQLRAAHADVGLTIRLRPRDGDFAVMIAVATPEGDRVEERLAFQRGDQGRARAAILAAGILAEALRPGEAAPEDR